MGDWIPTFASVVAALCLGSVLLIAIRSVQHSRGRRSPVRNGVEIECQNTRAVHDLLIDRFWRTTISVTNRSRKPRPVPVFASRATVAADRKVYLAEVFLERNAIELNPDDVLVVWVEYVIPAGVAPRSIEMTELLPEQANRRIALRLPRQGGGWLASILVERARVQQP